jgi:serine/threonine protein kinase
MKFCPNCKATYADDANFCPKESCATATGPQRLLTAPVATSAAAAPNGTHTAGAAGAAGRLGEITADMRSRFQLGARIGGSSTGEVYRAHDNVTGAQVAYKIVSSDVLPNAAAFARAEREFKQLMRVQSPRIATIIDCGRTADERLYVATELVEGESLDKTLRGTPVSLDRAKAIVAQVAQALLEAQKAGIVHRDVSPKNVLVLPSGDVKVINFPLAKPLNERAAGVAAYLSPEQVQGKPVDQRSNTYNLAAVLYHLLTGEPPFQGTPETVLDLHVSSPPLAPSQRRPEAGLPSEVDRVILKALDKSSSRRHLTLRLFLSEVEALHLPTAAPAAANPGREGPGGFARTMLFAGGQAEVANLVAKAIASRSGSPAGGVPITAGSSPTASGTVSSAQGAAAAGPRRHPSPTGTMVGHTNSGGANGGGIGSTSVGTANTLVSSQMPSAGSIRLSSPSGGVPAAVSPAPSPATAAEAQRNRATPAAAQNVAPASQPVPVSFATPEVSHSPPPASAAGIVATTTAPLQAPPPAQSAPAQVPATQAAPAAQPSPKAAAGKTGKEAAGEGKGGKDGKGTAFRETLWFKKGDVEHMIAEARAKIAGPDGGNKPAEAPSPAEETLPIEDRYVDDGTVTADDRKKFSLRAGQTAASLPVVRGRVPGESMSEAEVIREVSGSRKGVVLLVVAVVVLAVGAAIVTLMRSKPTPVPVMPPTAIVIPTPPAPPPAVPAKQGGPADEPPAPEMNKGKKLVATPPTKRSDGSDKRATRRKARDRRGR